jgi:choline dehydrogenase-like flavoprotein
VPPTEEVQKQVKIIHSDETIRKSNGPIETSFPEQFTVLHRAWTNTFRTLGLENVNDPLTGHAIGGHTSTCHITGDRHERSHAGVAYLDPVYERPNLTVFTNKMVQRLVIEKDSSGPVVRGVQYSQDGVFHTVAARREVILAAGTFDTPKLLELSGIGDPSILDQHGIDTVYANPAVGENLQDHVRASISFEVTDEVPTEMPIPIEEARRLYEKHRSGPLTVNGASMFSYTPLTPFSSREELESLKSVLDRYLVDDGSWSPFICKRNEFIRNAIGSANEATAVSFLVRGKVVPSEIGNFISICSMLSHPFSTGSVHITSANPEDKLKIDFNYYSHPLDAEIHARHVQVLDKLARTEPLASYILPNGKRLPREHPAGTIEDTKELARAYAKTNYHPCGTCSLGAVVDSRLKVKGVQNLRIVDASVMPIIPRGNIITTVYAVAERAADIVSEDLALRRQT